MFRMRNSHGLTSGSHRDVKVHTGHQLETSVDDQLRGRLEGQVWLVTVFSSRAGNWTRRIRNALYFAPLKQQLWPLSGEKAIKVHFFNCCFVMRINSGR